MIASGSTSITVYWIDDDGYRSIASGFSYALLSIIGSRLLHNLREVRERDVIVNGNCVKNATLSDMRFASALRYGSGEKSGFPNNDVHFTGNTVSDSVSTY